MLSKVLSTNLMEEPVAATARATLTSLPTLKGSSELVEERARCAILRSAGLQSPNTALLVSQRVSPFPPRALSQKIASSVPLSAYF